MRTTFIYLVTAVILVSSCRSPLNGTITYQVTSDTFTTVDNISLTIDHGDIYNTGNVTLPFEKSYKIDGNTLNYGAMLNVVITSTNNTTGGSITSKISFSEKEQDKELTKSYGLGQRIDQKMDLVTSQPTF